MSRRNGVLYLAGAAALLFASAAFAGTNGLTATLAAQKSFLGAADDAVVTVTYHNDSAEDIYLVRWQTALSGAEENLFDVRLDGQQVAYTGRLYKRAAPRAEDYVRIPAGSSRSARVELSGVYDMAHTGEYSIRYQVALADGLRGNTAKSLASLAGPGSLASNVVYIGAERDEAKAAAVEALVQEIQTKALAPSYVSCSSSRQSSLVTALSNAQTMSQKSQDYLNNLPTASRSTDVAYKTWFGAYTSSRYSGVQSDYVNLYNAFVNQHFTFYCDCTDSSYAYVFANQPYNVHLCNAFWSAPSLGTDSKAGTLVHETSHFNVVAKTQDYAYGQTACKSLATSNPSHAVHNADSHEYFAESR